MLQEVLHIGRGLEIAPDVYLHMLYTLFLYIHSIYTSEQSSLKSNRVRSLVSILSKRRSRSERALTRRRGMLDLR